MTNRHPFLELLLVRLREFYREPAVIFWVYGFPLFLAVGLGVAFAGGQPDDTRVDVERPAADGAEAEQLVRVLQDGGLLVEGHTPADCRRRLYQGITCLIIVPSADGYQYVYDPTRADARAARFQADSVIQRWKSSRAWQPRDVPTDEPGSRYIDFLIPGLMGLNLMGGGLWGVGFVIVDLRVRKLLKRLRATPMRRRDFLLSVLVSRLVFIVPEMLILVVFGRCVFGTPVRGSALALALVVLAGGAAFAGLGLLLAARTERTETVSGLINLLMLPMWMLSGTFFSSHHFPQALQPLIHALPLTHLNNALRGVMLEGAALADVAPTLGLLALWGVVPFVLALKLFRWQ
jgi:ABC transporter DrrB family efflux protein